MRTCSLLSLATLLAAVGCAAQRRPQPAAAPVAAKPSPAKPVLPPPPPPVKAIALRVDSAHTAKLGEKLNALLADARVPGATAHSQATVTLEDAQLSVECVEATAACYSAVGKSLGANRLLFAEIIKSGKKKKITGMRISVTLFDIDAGTVIRTVDRSFKKEADAVAAAKELVEQALGEVGASSTQPPPVAAAAPTGASAAKTTTASGTQSSKAK